MGILKSKFEQLMSLLKQLQSNAYNAGVSSGRKANARAQTDMAQAEAAKARIERLLREEVVLFVGSYQVGPDVASLKSQLYPTCTPACDHPTCRGCPRHAALRRLEMLATVGQGAEERIEQLLSLMEAPVEGWELPIFTTKSNDDGTEYLAQSLLDDIPAEARGGTPGEATLRCMGVMIQSLIKLCNTRSGDTT